MAAGVAIIQYHKVGATVDGRPDRFLNVTEQAFLRQMRMLRRLGYEVVTMETALRGLLGRAPLARRTACITFDDGYACVADCAAPVLRAMGWPATVFVPTAHVGVANTWDVPLGHPVLGLMDWPTLRTLHAAGWEIGGHCRSHPRLDLLDDAAALAEIQGGADDVCAASGCPPSTFCYPFGRLRPGLASLLQRCGYLGACTTRSGIAHRGCDAYLLPRVKVAYRDGVPGMLYRLLGRPLLG